MFNGEMIWGKFVKRRVPWTDIMDSLKGTRLENFGPKRFLKCAKGEFKIFEELTNEKTANNGVKKD